jgi:parvulin-like peptidyl-prolyl isomerase
VVSFLADSFRPDVTVSDADVASYFEAHKADFKIPEKRKVRYALIDVEAMRAKTVVSAQEIERAYNTGIEQYTTPEQVRASHILLKTEGKDDAVVKAKAEEVLKQAKAGADFGELAKKNSEDEQSAKNGGDLDYFGRGRMVPEFDQVAFTLKPGEISDVVTTQFGYHIIKLTEKKDAAPIPLEQVKPQVLEFLTNQKKQQRVDGFIEDAKKRAKIEVLV